MEYSIAKEIKDIDNLIIRKISKESPELKKVSPTQIRIMVYLIRHMNEDVYQKDIESATGLRRSTVSGVIDTMIKNGMVEKSNSIVDGRSKKIVLTSKVLDKRRECIMKFMSLDNILNNNISSDELKIFFKVTNQIKENLIKEER